MKQGLLTRCTCRQEHNFQPTSEQHFQASTWASLQQAAQWQGLHALLRF